MKVQTVKTSIVNVFMVLVFTLIALMISEGLIRVLPKEFIESNKVLEGDPLLGSPPRHYASVELTDISKDFPQQAKPKDVYRIVVLGDSHTVSVTKRSTYPDVLEVLLNGIDLKGKRVEVHNAGAPGHSHYQYYLSLDKKLKQYEPDLVIVGFYIGNDFLDLYRNDDRPNLSFDGDEFVHSDPDFYRFKDPGQTNNRLLETSRFLRFVRDSLRLAIGYEMDRVRVVWRIGEKTGVGNIAATKFLYPVIRGYFIHQHIFRQSMLQMLFLERFPKEREVIDTVNHRVTQLMKETAERNDMKLLYVPIPTKLQIEPNSDPEVLRKTLEICDMDVDALKIEERLYESLASLLNAHGITHVDVRPALRDRANQDVLYDRTYHLTETSHEIIANSLYTVVEPVLLSLGE